MDWSSYYSAGGAKPGFRVVKINTIQELKGPVKPHSAQATEVVAVLKMLQMENQEATLAIFTYLDGVCRAVVAWLSIWASRDMYTGDGKPVAHAQYWEQVMVLIKGRKGDNYVTHLKATSEARK